MQKKLSKFLINYFDENSLSKEVSLIAKKIMQIIFNYKNWKAFMLNLK